MRSDSGQIKPELKMDPLIRFQVSFVKGRTILWDDWTYIYSKNKMTTKSCDERLLLT